MRKTFQQPRTDLELFMLINAWPAVEMKQATREYANMHLINMPAPRRELLHLQGIAYERIATEIAQKVFADHNEE